jgi:hypothetical protein
VSQREIIEQAVRSIASQRHLLGNDVVDLSLVALQQKLAALQQPVSKSGISTQFTSRNQLFDRSYLVVLAAGLPEKRDGSAWPDEILDQMWRSAEQIIRHWGGIVIEQASDERLALFGMKSDAEEAAQRAVRAALALQTELSLLPPDSPGRSDDELLLRIGLHRAQVDARAVANLEARRLPNGAINHMVRFVRRLKALAPPGRSLMCYDMSQAVGHLFEVEAMILPDAESAADSQSELYAIAYLATEDKGPDFWWHLRNNGMVPRLLGHQTEYDLLQQQFEQVVARRQARLVTVMGETGLGKSHLLYHFEQWLNMAPVSTLVLRGRVRACWWQWPRPPLGNALADLLDLRLYDSKRALQKKIKAGLSRYLPAEMVSDAAVVVENWLGLNNGEPDNYSVAQWLLMLVRLLKAIVSHDKSDRPSSELVTVAQEKPVEVVVLLLEDLHWADEASINLVEAIFRQCYNLPLLLIGSAEPALRDKRPSWPSDIPNNQHTLLKLSSLSAIEARHLVGAFLPHKAHKGPLPLKLYELLATGSRRTPLYIREAIRLLQLQGQLEPLEPLWMLSGLDKTSLAYVRPAVPPKEPVRVLPDSLPALFESQLTAVSAAALSVLQKAAIVGYSFSDTAVAYLSDKVANGSDPIDVSAVLDALLACGLIRRQPFSIYRQGRAFSFNHPLLRQIVYEQLSQKQRQQYQQRLAAWQEEQKPEYQVAVQLPDPTAFPDTTRQQQPVPGSMVDRPLRNQ